MKRIFKIDWALVPVFVCTVLTGVRLHLADYDDAHEVWHIWAVAHVVVSLLFIILVEEHVRTHRKWYENVWQNGLGNKSRMTVVVTVVFVGVSVSGLLLLGVKGANSVLGLWHYRLGAFSSLFFMGHIVKRIPVLRKSLWH